MKYLLDTHTWIWWHVRPQNLSEKVRKIISRVDNYEELLLSAISPWEFSMLLKKRRLGISCPPEEWLNVALSMPRLRLVPLSPLIAYRSTVLPPTCNGDPADRIIVATAREENAIILTKDRNIHAYQHVRTIW